MKRSLPFAAGGLASLPLIVIGMSVTPAIAQSPAPVAKSSVVERAARPAKVRAQARRGVDKANALAPRSGVKPTALTSAECRGLGGKVYGIKDFCKASGLVCVTVDSQGNDRNVCVNETK